MQVIYVKPILQRIIDERLKADIEDREIDKIILTTEEGRKLAREVSGVLVPMSKGAPRMNMVMGVRIEFEDPNLTILTPWFRW
jgi:hypothetical protein